MYFNNKCHWEKPIKRNKRMEWVKNNLNTTMSCF